MAEATAVFNQLTHLNAAVLPILWALFRHAPEVAQPSSDPAACVPSDAAVGRKAGHPGGVDRRAEGHQPVDHLAKHPLDDRLFANEPLHGAFVGVGGGIVLHLGRPGFIDRLTKLFLAFVDVWADVPADAIMFGDDWGFQQGVLLGPERWRTFIKPRWAKVYQAVHDQGKRTISHSCGSVVDIMPDIIEIGLDVLESVQPEARGMNPYALKKEFGSQITFWGCLGSQSTIQFSSPQGIAAEVRRLCAGMGAGGGYILAPAKSLQPGTPVENAAAVVEAFTEQ